MPGEQGFEGNVDLARFPGLSVGVDPSRARGGERVELRLLENVQQDGRVHPIPRDPERRVFSARTSRTVREMMALVNDF